MASRSSHPCVVGSGTRVSGTLSGSEDVLVLGRLEGNVSLSAELTVAPDAEVEASLSVDRAVVGGQVVGDIEARHSLVLERGSRVEGKLVAPNLVIAEGAEVFGEVEMDVDIPDALLSGRP